MTSLSDAVRRTQRRGFGLEELTPAQIAADEIRGSRAEARELLADSLIRELDVDRRRQWAQRGIEVDHAGVHVNGVRIYDTAQLAQPAIRASLNESYDLAFHAYLRNVAQVATHGTGTDSRARDLLSPRESNALRQGVAEGGGYLLPAPIAGAIAATRAAISVIRGSGAPVIPVPHGGRLRVPVGTAHSTDNYEGGWIGGWSTEVPTDIFAASTEPAFSLAEAPLSRAVAGLRIGQDLLSDADVDISDWLLTSGARNLASLEDTGFWIGDGLNGEPFGILNQYPSGSLIDVEGSAAAITAASLSKLSTLLYGLPGQYRERAAWAMRPSVEAKVRTVVDAAGFAPFQAYGSSAMAGYPVRSTSAIPADGTADNRCIVFGDLSAAVVIGETPLKVRVSDSLYRRQDQAVIVMSQRSACVLTAPNALRIGAC